MAADSDASSRQLRRCSDAHTSKQCLSRAKVASILSWPTIMSYYKLLIAIFTALDTIWCYRVELAAVSDASSGHLRRCRDVDATNHCLSREKDASILSWPAIMGYLEAVDCRNHSVRYDMVLLSRAGLRLRCLIRSPTTL